MRTPAAYRPSDLEGAFSRAPNSAHPIWETGCDMFTKIALGFRFVLSSKHLFSHFTLQYAELGARGDTSSWAGFRA